MSKYAGKIVTNQAPAGYSVFFDGNGDYLSLASNAAFAFGTGDFTIEVWINPASLATDTLICGVDATSGAILGFSTTTVWLGSRSVSYDLTATYTLQTNTWTHLAVTRQGTTARIFANGVQIVSGTVTNNYAQGQFAVGNYITANIGVNGYLSNVRVLKGTALYTAAFTPPTQLLNITNTSLLTCNSPAFVDQSSNGFAISAAGTPSVSTFTPFTAYVPYNPALGASTPGVWTLDEAMQAAATRQWNMYDPSFQNTTLLLHGNGTNAAQNNTFLDSSSNNFTITRNGNTTQGSFSPFSQTGWSNYFDGSSKLNIGSSTPETVLQLASSDFTVEAWVYTTSSSAAWQYVISNLNNGVGNLSWAVRFYGSTGVISFLWGTSTSYLGNVEYTSSAGAVVPNTWTNITVTRSGSTFRIYANGVQVGTGTSATAIYSQTQQFTIGSTIDNADRMNGYISNLRITKGGVLYTTNFTPSATPLTTTVSAGSVSALTCQSNRFVDNSSNALAVTVGGGTPSVQAFSPFYPTAAYTPQTIGGSGYFDGTGDWLTVGAASDWTFLHNGSDWTCEFWVYHTGTALYGVISTTAFAAETGMSILLNNTNNSGVVNGVQVYIARGVNGSETAFNSTGLLRINAWNYVAITFTSSTKTCAFTINGTSAGSSSNTGFAYSSSNPTNTLAIGRYQGSSPGGNIVGYLGSLRVSTNIRTGLTTVPTSPYTSDANTKLLCNFTNAGIVDSTAKNVLETVGNAQISTTQSKFGGSSMYFDGTGDYLLISQNNQSLMLGTAPFTIEFWFNTTSSTQYAQFVGNETTNGFTILINVASATAGTVAVYNGAAGQIHISTSSYRDGAWHHFALSRDSSGSRMFIDGTQIGSTNTGQASASFDATSFRWAIGANLQYSGRDYAGYIDDLRITKGIARYTANFTPQTSQWQDQ